MIKICTPHESICRFRLEYQAREYIEEMEYRGLYAVTIEFRDMMWEVILKDKVKHERMAYAG